MTPQELDAVCFLAEQLAVKMYAKGYADGKEGKAEEPAPKLTKGSKLLLKTQLDKISKNR